MGDCAGLGRTFKVTRLGESGLFRPIVERLAFTALFCDLVAPLGYVKNRYANG